MPYIEHDFPIEDLNRIAQKEGNAKKPIYQMHKWWARRIGSVFRMLILTTFAEDDLERGELWRRFYSRNQLLVTDPDGTTRPPIVLDPFMGGGTTIVEALRLGCKVVGVDLNPVAWFVTKKEIEPVDLETLDETFKQLEKTAATPSRSTTAMSTGIRCSTSGSCSAWGCCSTLSSTSRRRISANCL